MGYTQPALNFLESYLIGGGPPPVSVRNNDSPAKAVIRDYRQRGSRLLLSKIKLFRNQPTQITARDALLSHDGARCTSSFPLQP